METQTKKEPENENLAAFLDALTELSRRFSLGITQEGVLFELESDDFERTYTCDEESRLIYK